MLTDIKGFIWLSLTLFFVQITNSDTSLAYQDFDSIPLTAVSDTPNNGGGWEYSSGATNTGKGIATGGWYETKGYASANNIHDYFFSYLNTSNNTHIGFSTYGYVEIDDFAVSGHSLKYTVTGGYRDVNGVTKIFGRELLNKETYLSHPEYVDQSGEVIGHPYFYFSNSSSNPNVYFEKSQGANRLSFYVWLPNEVINGAGKESFPLITLGVGPYTGQGTNHWYNSCYFEGGGWTHVQVDGHPNHNNAWSSADLYPYPSSSLRDMERTYFNEMYRFYISVTGGVTNGDTGIAAAPYSIWLDEIDFHYDSEPQNDETINTITISYNQETKIWQVGFNEKYKNNGYSRPVYELRYSFSPITNANWQHATPALIQTDSRYPNIKLSTPGEFRKNNGWYANTWAPFRLKTEDEQLLTEGTTIYFAVKDVGQSNGNEQAQRAKGEGRDYLNYPDEFDYSGDVAALMLIKRIDFRIPATIKPTTKPKILYITPRY